MTTFKEKKIFVEVTNAHDTTSDPKIYGYRSWREYWEANGHSRNELNHQRADVELKDDGTHQFIEKYQCVACGKYYQWDGAAPECFDGCHVWIVGDPDQKEYIFPFCHTCNHLDFTVEVRASMLVPAPAKIEE